METVTGGQQRGSLAALAKRLKVSRPAVTNGVKRGRLPRSVVRDATGHPLVIDMDLAEREWRENSNRIVKSNGHEHPAADRMVSGK